MSTINEIVNQFQWFGILGGIIQNVYGINSVYHLFPPKYLDHLYAYYDGKEFRMIYTADYFFHVENENIFKMSRQILSTLWILGWATIFGEF